MSKRRGPGLDERRESDFNRELLERARLWIPSWDAPEGEPDFGQALLAIAARFNAEVAERLDKGADKMALGFLDWLAIRGQAAIPARMPVVFKLADNAQAVSAPAPVQLQVDTVVFETENEVRLVPSQLELVVGADSGDDAYYLPPPGLSSLDPLEPLPTQWQIRSFAAPGSGTLQLDPPLGLAPDMLIDIGGQQFRIDAVNDDLVTIDPPVPAGDGFDGALVKVRKVSTFDPFGGSARNRQFHALYLGHPDLLNIESEATISVNGIDGLPAGTAWHYWGKRAGAEASAWQPFLPGSNAAVLSKPKGDIETRKVGEVESRWIRASIAKVPPGAPLSSDALTLCVNPVDLTGTCPIAGAAGGVEGVEALNNNTPLELTDIFFPLGREPRQFDAFYLGSAEAFSKRGAKVRVCLDIADASFTSFACLRVSLAKNLFLAGVAQDGHLHCLSFQPWNATLTDFRKPLRPPSPAFGGATVPGLPVALDTGATFRPALWSRESITGDISIAVSAGTSVWMWTEIGFIPNFSGWVALGAVDPTPGLSAEIKGLVHLREGAGGRLFALLGTKLYVRDPDDTGSAWSLVEVKRGGAEVALEKIVPIVDELKDLGSGTLTEGLVGIGSDQSVYAITIAATAAGLAGTCTLLFEHAEITVAPAAVRRLDQCLLVAAACELSGKKVLRASLSAPNLYAPASPVERVFLEGVVVGYALDVNVSSGQLGFALTLQPDRGGPAIAWWSPYNAPVSAQLMTTEIPASVGTPAGAPTLLAQHVVVPAQSSRVLVAEFSLARQQTFFTHLRAAVITPLSDTPLAATDSIAVVVGAATLELRHIVADGVNHAGETLYEMDSPYTDRQSSDALRVYRGSGAGFVGEVLAADTIRLDMGDAQTMATTVLLIATDLSVGLYQVTQVANTDEATLTPDLDMSAGTLAIDYWCPEFATGRVAPLMKLNPATSGNWDAALLGRTRLTFPGADPERQRGTAFQVDANRHPMLVALEYEFIAEPIPTSLGAKFVVDGALDKWSIQLGETRSNPDLSWEYWNGTAWWKLAGLSDETLNLKRSGAIRFDIPADMQPTDWSGKSNHWVRARLVGGDFGQPRTVVKSKTLADGSTEQSVDRLQDDIRAPQVLRLRVQYSAATPVLPTHVVTADSGAVRDQSDANRTPGALVSMFTHLGSALPASSQQAQPAGAPAQCPADCACGPGVPATPAAAGTEDAAPNRALYLGFSAELAGQPVNLLVLVDKEQQFDQFAPLRIEALVGEHFVPVVAEDTTRALGESGLLSLSLTLPTVLAGLFGRALCWLRLAPTHPGDGWKPSLRGVYINAAWARAAETMTRERLGSSIGAPGQVLLLARPPLLRNTLELRVREALSGEERAALVQADPANVVSDVASDLRGHWVLWRPVTDVDDSGPLERVYSLDETSGAVRFGDGLHGMIPPIGRDAIVAFSYQRTDPGPLADVVPANMVAQRTVLNLVTPVEGVEAAFAADQSAGGAPPELADRVQRFAPARLRHRGRALTLRDFEEHALQSSPDIAQARAFSASNGVRMVVSMRGKDVQPSQAVRRELRRTLLAAAPSQLALAGALDIAGPALRRLRISVSLRVASLDGSGRLANYVKRSLAGFFDAAMGGLDRQGWPLGADPAEDDVALALLDAPDLEGIEQVRFDEIAADGSAAPWRHQMRRNQLAVLADDGVRIDFVVVETEP